MGGTNMIKELIYENEYGQRESLLAQEKTVEYLFKNRYADYLKDRLGSEKVRFIQTKKYVRPTVTVLPLETLKVGVKQITEDEMKMVQAEQRMTQKKAMDVMIKYTEKKTRTR